jgi:hypothetical protein
MFIDGGNATSVVPLFGKHAMRVFTGEILLSKGDDLLYAVSLGHE